MAEQPPWTLVKEIFNAVHDSPRDQRPAVLERACRGDVSLRREIESLLEASDDDLVPTGAIAPPISELPTVMRPSMVSDEVGTSIGPYRLIEELGEGGFGTVFLAEQHTPVHRLVALKVIKLGMDTRQVIARFEAERQALAMMDHPSIARVLDAGTTNSGRPYFVMELVRGRPITEFCDTQRLTIRERLALFEQVCRALHHAHQKGIIHRDVKPSNVLVTLIDGDRPLPKVIDFGIAKATSARLTEKTLVTEHRGMIGTPEYMSPEQANDQLGVDTRTDVYSLGVLLYELLTGCTPFQNEILRKASFAEVQRILQEVEPPAPSSRVMHQGPDVTAAAAKRASDPKRLGSMIRGELDWIVLKAIEKNPGRRYESALAMVTDVRRFLDGHAVHAAPPSKFYRAQKLLLRHRKPVAALAIGSLSLMMITIVAVIQWYKADAATNRIRQYAEASDRNARNAEASEQRATLERDAARKAQQDTEIARANEQRAARVALATEYAANLAIAGSAAERDEPRTLRDHLIEARKSGVGWEWNYLNAAADSSLLTFAGHRAPMYAITFTRDGARLITASADMTCKAFDTETGVGVATFDKHQDAVIAVASSPDNLIASVTPDEAWVWDAFAGDPIKSLPAPFHAAWSGAAFTPDGSALLLACADGTVRSFTGAAWEPAWALDSERGAAITALAVSRDGSLIATGGSDGVSDVWDRVSRRRISTFFRQLSTIRHVGFSPDSSQIVTSAPGEDAFVWDARSGSPLRRLRTDAHFLSGAEFSPDGRFIGAGAGNSVVLFNAMTGAEVCELRGHTSTVTALAFDADGSRVAAAGQDKSVRLWHVADATGASMPAGRLSGGNGSVWSPDATRFVIATGGGGASVWSLQGLERVLAVQGPSERDESGDKVEDAFFTPDGNRIVTANRESGRGVIWDAETGAKVAELRPYSKFEGFEAQQRVHAEVWTSADGRLAAAPTSDRRVQVFDRATGRLVRMLDTGLARFSSFSPDSRHLLVGTINGAGIWELATAKLVVGLGEAAPGGVGIQSGVYSRDGTRLLTLSDQNEVRVWTASGQVIEKPGNSSLRSAGVREATGGGSAAPGDAGHANLRTLDKVVFSTDSSRLLIPISDSAWEIWQIDAGGGGSCRLGCTLACPVSGIRVATFSPDGSRLVLGGARGYLAVFDTAVGRELLTLVGHAGGINAVTFSADGQRVLSSDDQDEIRIWDARPADARHAERERVLAAQLENQRDIKKWVERIHAGEDINGVRSSIAADRTLDPLRRWAAHALVTREQTRARADEARLIAAAESAPFTGQPDPGSVVLVEKLTAALGANRESLPLAEALSLMHYKQGRYDLVIKAFEDDRRTRQSPSLPEGFVPLSGRPTMLACVVMSQARLRQKEEAMESLQELRTMVRDGHQNHPACRRRLLEAEAVVDELARWSANAPPLEQLK